MATHKALIVLIFYPYLFGGYNPLLLNNLLNNKMGIFLISKFAVITILYIVLAEYGEKYYRSYDRIAKWMKSIKYYLILYLLFVMVITCLKNYPYFLNKGSMQEHLINTINIIGNLSWGFLIYYCILMYRYCCLLSPEKENNLKSPEFQ